MPAETSKPALFDENEHLTDAGLKLDEALRPQLQSMFAAWSAAGYKIRDIEYILCAAVTEAACLARLGQSDLIAGGSK